MAVETNLPGVGSNVTDFNVDLSVQSLNPGNSQGGTGSLAFGTAELPRPQMLRNRRFTLTDTEGGSFIGRVSVCSWSRMGVQFSAELMTNRLNVDVTVRPVNAALNLAIDSAMSVAGMYSSGLPSTVTTIPGWRGSLWEYLKHFCSVYHLEMLPSGTDPDELIFRPVRTSQYNPQVADIRFGVNDQQLAQAIEVVNYRYGAMSGSNIEFTPSHVDDMQVLSVNAGEVVTYDVRVNGWVNTVNQPVVMDLVGPEERTDTGAYCVAGADGLPITAAQWTAQGGRLEVRAGDDPSVLHITLTAPGVPALLGTDGEDHLAPYSIAATAGESDMYNSLHITGTGLLYNKQTISFPTGVSAEITVEPVGIQVDNPWVRDREIAYMVGVRTAQAWAGSAYTFDQATTDNRAALRDILGARLAGDAVNFRVEGVTLTAGTLTFRGAADTTFDDFDGAMDGLTFDQWATLVAGMTFDAWAPVPLKNT